MSDHCIFDVSLRKISSAVLASAKIRRINIRKGYKDYRKKLPTKAAIVVSSMCFISLQLSILCLSWLPARARRVGPGFLPYQADLAVRVASAKLLNAPG